MSNPIVAARYYALQDIDREAGVTRLRYITDVPGQQAVYIVKLQQADAYAAAVALDAQAPVPSYIAAEASGTGQTALAVAQAVLLLAGVWNDQIGPAIEGARLGGKTAVTAAETAEDIAAARDAAITALRAI